MGSGTPRHHPGDRPHRIGQVHHAYGALEEINDGVRKLISVEDPVEYQVPNITQVQVHADIGLTFAAALRRSCGRIPM